MSGLRLGEDRRSEIAGLVDEMAEHDAETVWARAVWSLITEPGDAVAGALVAALGPVGALAVVTGAVPAPAGEGADALREGLQRWRPRLAPAAIDAMLAAGRRAGLRMLTPECGRWPDRLADLGPHAPLCLWVRGDVSALSGTASGAAAAGAAVAMVGARAATSYGEQVAIDLSAGLTLRGATVVSGAAYGIDGAAHRAVLNSGGITIAVLAGGADRSYPAGHSTLIDQIADTGAVVAEVPPGTAPTRWRFLQRNRVIAALADATVVVEAGWRSGSLNTAGHAAALGRALGAVPGPVTSATSAGCHRLMREYDARCITGIDDVMELIGGFSAGGAGASRRASRTADEVRVLDALSVRSRRSADDVARRAGLTAAQAEAVLGMLDLEGLVERDERGWRRRASGTPPLF